MNQLMIDHFAQSWASSKVNNSLMKDEKCSFQPRILIAVFETEIQFATNEPHWPLIRHLAK